MTYKNEELATSTPSIMQSTTIVKMETPIPLLPVKVPTMARKLKERRPLLYCPRTPSPLGLGNIDISDDDEYEGELGDVGDDTGDETEESRGTSLNTIKPNYRVSKASIISGRKIPLFIHGDHVLIFDAKDMKELTIKYGITGQLSGILPLAPQQNLLLGFPLRLSVYEVLWCLYLNIGYLVDAREVINDGLLTAWKDDDGLQLQLIAELEEKLDKWREEKQREIDEQMKKLNIIKPEKKRIAVIDREGALLTSASMPDLNQLGESKEEEMREKKREERELHEKSKRNKIVFMETLTCDATTVDRVADFSNVIAGKQIELIRKLVNTEVEDYFKIWLNFKMFKYLKLKFNYQILPGMRFGGTFVAYPGDPLRYHAHQIVETKKYYDEDIGLFKICNRGRLATGVRKVWVVGGTPNDDMFRTGSVDLEDLVIESEDGDSGGDMVCFSIEWAGF